MLLSGGGSLYSDAVWGTRLWGAAYAVSFMHGAATSGAPIDLLHGLSDRAQSWRASWCRPNIGSESSLVLFMLRREARSVCRYGLQQQQDVARGRLRYALFSESDDQGPKGGPGLQNDNVCVFTP